MRELVVESIPSLCSKVYHEDPRVILAKEIDELLHEQGFCYVRVEDGDYKGSVAKFTLEKTQGYYADSFVTHIIRGAVNIRGHWNGRLSWKGKRNNPMHTITGNTTVLIPEGDEVIETQLVRFDMNSAKKELLKKDSYDMDGNVLSVGDAVLYINMRYGSGGRLCRGEVTSFHAHAREGYVSVLINNEDGQSSVCRHPRNQILKEK